MSVSESRFWQEMDRYHDLAETYERNIERYNPDRVTSRGMCVCLDYCNYCGWAVTQVSYYRYNGPDVQNI